MKQEVRQTMIRSILKLTVFLNDRRSHPHADIARLQILAEPETRWFSITLDVPPTLDKARVKIYGLGHAIFHVRQVISVLRKPLRVHFQKRIAMRRIAAITLVDCQAGNID